MLEINLFSLLPSVEVGSETCIHVLGSKMWWPYVRFKTKQNPIRSKVLTKPLTIWNYVDLLRKNWLLFPRNYFDNRISR